MGPHPNFNELQECELRITHGYDEYPLLPILRTKLETLHRFRKQCDNVTNRIWLLLILSEFGFLFAEENWKPNELCVNLSKENIKIQHNKMYLGL